MVKDIGEVVKAILEFFRSPRIFSTVFLSSGMWLVPQIRRFLPVHGDTAKIADLVASVCFTVSGAALLVSAVIWVYSALTAEERVQNRKLRKALTQATPVEKELLKTIIGLGKWEVGLDPGSDIAMHLQKIGLIRKILGKPGKTSYEIVPGFSDLCIRHPELLQQPPNVEKAAVGEIDQWPKTGAHPGFLRQLQPPGPHSWMG